jgi:hypothetical protein
VWRRTALRSGTPSAQTHNVHTQTDRQTDRQTDTETEGRHQRLQLGHVVVDHLRVARCKVDQGGQLLVRVVLGGGRLPH